MGCFVDADSHSAPSVQPNRATLFIKESFFCTAVSLYDRVDQDAVSSRAALVTMWTAAKGNRIIAPSDKKKSWVEIVSGQSFIGLIMASNHFGWSLSDAVDDPRRTGLANFRHKLLVQQQQYVDNNPLTCGDEELIVASASPVMGQHYSPDETLGTVESSASNPLKPYYRPSVSQYSDSCFGSEYPSLTSTGKSLLLFLYY